MAFFWDLPAHPRARVECPRHEARGRAAARAPRVQNKAETMINHSLSRHETPSPALHSESLSSQESIIYHLSISTAFVVEFTETLFLNINACSGVLEQVGIRASEFNRHQTALKSQTNTQMSPEDTLKIKSSSRRLYPFISIESIKIRMSPIHIKPIKHNLSKETNRLITL